MLTLSGSRVLSVLLGLLMVGVAAVGSQGPALMAAGAAVLAVGVAFLTPAFFSAVFATAEPAQRGAASGTASAFMDLGFGAGPVLAGYVAEGSSISGAFWAAALVALAGSAWTASLVRSARVRR